ncbi:MAG TPA: HEAT repeat domain-containing protein [Thermoanaerobaculia bacterium]|jgi:hypothetical protein
MPIAQRVDQKRMASIAYDLDLDMNNYIEATAEQPLEIVYNVAGLSTFLHYIEDRILGVPYLVARGDEAERLAAEVAKKIRIVTAADLARTFAAETADDAELRRHLAHAALLAPPQHDATFDGYFRAAFSHPSAEVRRFMIVAVGYIGWPELAPPLQHLVENDPDSDVRRDAGAMLGALLEGAK